MTALGCEFGDDPNKLISMIGCMQLYIKTFTEMQGYK